MLDRTITPPFTKVDSISIPPAIHQRLGNGIPLHLITSGTPAVVKIELIFKAGSWNEQQAEAAWFTLKMLSEGTTNQEAKSIASMLDYYGAELEINPGKDYSFVALYCLDKFAGKLLQLLIDVWQNPIFPAEELEKMKFIRKQNLRVNMEKTSFLAGVHFRNALYGDNHPYGRMVNPENIDAIDTEHLKAFHQSFLNRPHDVLVCGNPSKETLDLINNSIGNLQLRDNALIDAVEPGLPKQNLLIEKPESLQSTIRMGQHSISKSHPDYPKLALANEILGGYFGSRLMKNIREEKGLTYGIFSALINMINGDYLMIGSDVKRENTQLVEDEIIREIKILQTERVSDDELQKVKNYMSGSFVMSFNNAFALADKFKEAHLHGLDYGYYNDYLHALNQTTAEEIVLMANQYFNIEKMQTVIAGGKN